MMAAFTNKRPVNRGRRRGKQPQGGLEVAHASEVAPEGEDGEI